MDKINGNDVLGFFELEDIKSRPGEDVNVSACVHKVKNMGGFAFIIIRTPRWLIQTV